MSMPLTCVFLQATASRLKATSTAALSVVSNDSGKVTCILFTQPSSGTGPGPVPLRAPSTFLAFVDVRAI